MSSSVHFASFCSPQGTLRLGCKVLAPGCGKVRYLEFWGRFPITGLGLSLAWVHDFWCHLRLVFEVLYSPLLKVYHDCHDSAEMRCLSDQLEPMHRYALFDRALPTISPRPALLVPFLASFPVSSTSCISLQMTLESRTSCGPFRK